MGWNDIILDESSKSILKKMLNNHPFLESIRCSISFFSEIINNINIIKYRVYLFEDNVIENEFNEVDIRLMNLLKEKFNHKIIILNQ